MKELIEALKLCEQTLDKFNGDHGSHNKLREWCSAYSYDGNGIVHMNNCPLSVARRVLATTGEQK